jgi:hypothetical protein
VQALKNVIATIDAEPSQTEINQATRLCETLLGQNPTNRPDNPKVYRNTLLAIFTAYPPSVTSQAIHPVRGLIANLQYSLKPSDLKAFMDRKLEERARIKINAFKQLKEHERRKEWHEREETWRKERAQRTPEERKAFVESVMRGFIQKSSQTDDAR